MLKPQTCTPFDGTKFFAKSPPLPWLAIWAPVKMASVNTTFSETWNRGVSSSKKVYSIGPLMKVSCEAAGKTTIILEA